MNRLYYVWREPTPDDDSECRLYMGRMNREFVWYPAEPTDGDLLLFPSLEAVNAFLTVRFKEEILKGARVGSFVIAPLQKGDGL